MLPNEYDKIIECNPKNNILLYNSERINFIGGL